MLLRVSVAVLGSMEPYGLKSTRNMAFVAEKLKMLLSLGGAHALVRIHAWFEVEVTKLCKNIHSLMS